MFLKAPPRQRDDAELTRLARRLQFYNAVLFMGSVAVFSLIAQRANARNMI